MDQFHRLTLIYGEDYVRRIAEKRVVIIGLGGVGSYAAEILVRSGFSNILLVDFDKVKVTNLNRQIIALHSTIGKQKTEVMQERMLDINPEANIEIMTDFCSDETMPDILKDADFVIDAIDSVVPKTNLIVKLHTEKIPFISVMGAGGKTDPSKIAQADLFKTQNCALARRIRKYLRRRGIKSKVPVIYSSEVTTLHSHEMEDQERTSTRGRSRNLISSVAYLPAIMGCWAAGYVLEFFREQD